MLIITDQQRADTLGVYGSTVRATPTLDALASSGVTFRRGYCNNPLCMPSRASILTGRYPSATGVRTNGCVISLTPATDSFLHITSVIDNLRKGASGQAVQNFNLMFGFAETTALI